MLRLEFTDPLKRTPMSDGFAEINSKGLDPKSKLVQLLEKIRKDLHVYATEHKLEYEKPRPFHVELEIR